jgi:acetyl/propionyl-CoA carboxylase alpha subunit/acetyl-CoA carboxylase carboxyltransferase component
MWSKRVWRQGVLAGRSTWGVRGGMERKVQQRNRSTQIQKLLIANRGEIAIRISRTANEMGIQTVGICSQDETLSLHNKRVHQSVVLSESGPAAYLNSQAIVDIAVRMGCDGIHPGYGFLSENSQFAELCGQNNLKFIGPTPQLLKTFGDKSLARQVANHCGVRVIPGSSSAVNATEALHFFQSLPHGSAMIIKAISGGGGKGMRIVNSAAEIPDLIARCQSEALSSFGDDRVYVEQFIPNARHIEVQVLGDGEDVSLLWERECSLQRNHQKLIEIAPSPSLSENLTERIYAAARSMAIHTKYLSLGTFEFLLDLDHKDEFYFLETNPRLQVEHTVTEQITGLDLVKLQLCVANQMKLSSMEFLAPEKIKPRGYALQLRVNMETLNPSSADFKTTSGLISIFEPPSGIGVRVDSFAYSGYQTSSRYDSLLAKLIVHTNSSHFADCVDKAYLALSEFRVEGLQTNIPYLLSLLQTEEVRTNEVTTRSVNLHLQRLSKEPQTNKLAPLERYFRNVSTTSSSSSSATTAESIGEEEIFPEGTKFVVAPMPGTIIEVKVEPEQQVYAGQPLVIMEAMKMQHPIPAPCSGTVKKIRVQLHDTVTENQSILVLEPGEVDSSQVEVTPLDPQTIRPDLQESIARHAFGLDSTRAVAVKKRHGSGNRTARENIEDICDPETFLEYGALAIAAQRRRRSFDDLVQNTPADGLVAGIGSVNGNIFTSAVNTQCLVLAYDYMVLAGTQGLQNHRKKDRMFELAEKMRIPIILFAEGGGGRPGDTDTTMIAGLDCMAFALYAKLSGLVPRIGIANGRCFAGNAALLGMSDVIIATENSNIGMGGPAMIEGGGLGVYRPEEIGPVSVQRANGVVDLVAKDEAEAVAIAKKYLSYFQGAFPGHGGGEGGGGDLAEDQHQLRHIIPENRLAPYDIRRLIEILADSDSVLELRSHFGMGIVTSFGRIAGQPIGILANNPKHLGGAIDSASADKASRFIQLCDAFDIPLLTLVDTPGIMVGPEIEKTALVRHVSRLFVTSTTVTIPIFTVVLRKGYGLGAQAMAGGSFKMPAFTITWPTGEFGGMGLEGAVRLGYKKEMAMIASEEERQRFYEGKVKEMYEVGKAVNYATAFELDGVIDPKDTRAWIINGMKSAAAGRGREASGSREGKKRPMIDSW